MRVHGYFLAVQVFVFQCIIWGIFIRFITNCDLIPSALLWACRQCKDIVNLVLLVNKSYEFTLEV